MGLVLGMLSLACVAAMASANDENENPGIQANTGTRLSIRGDEIDDEAVRNAGPVSTPALAAPGEQKAVEPAAGEESAVISRPPVQDSRRVERAAPSNSPTDAQGMLQMLWPLFIVLLVVGGLAYAARRWMPKSLRTSSGGPLQIIARQSISAKQSLCLVRLGRRLVLMGVTSDRISTLSEINDPEESAAIVAAVESSRPTSFATAFGKMSDQDLKAAEADDDETMAAFNTDDTPLGTKQIAQTRDRVRGLLDRVRGLAGELTSTSAEPARGAAAPR